MKGLQSVYNQITNILKENNVLMNITPPRPYLIKKMMRKGLMRKQRIYLKNAKLKNTIQK